MDKKLIERLSMERFPLVPFTFNELDTLQLAEISAILAHHEPNITGIHYEDDTVHIEGPQAPSLDSQIYLDADKLTSALFTALSKFDIDPAHHSVINVCTLQNSNHLYISINLILA